MSAWKYTPGEWTVGTNGGFVWAGEQLIASVFPCEEGRELEMRANARLIAAAPDGLAAARQALDECCDLIGTSAGDALAAFIAKATGQEGAAA